MNNKSSYIVISLCSDGSFSVPSSHSTIKQAEMEIKRLRLYSNNPAWVFESNPSMPFNHRCMVREDIPESYMNIRDFKKLYSLYSRLYDTVNNFIYGILII